MRTFLITCVSILLLHIKVQGQQLADVIRQTDVAHIERSLAADSMQGRRIFTPGIEKAARLIAACFETAGLKEWPGAQGYNQKFEMVSSFPESVSAQWGPYSLSKENILSITTQAEIDWDSHTGLQIDSITSLPSFKNKIGTYLHPGKNSLVWVDTALSKTFFALKKHFSAQSHFKDHPTVVFVLAGHMEKDFHIKISSRLKTRKAANIVGYLPGTVRPDEYVVFSAHYDHLGTDSSLEGDTIYNGANDDASGTTAVIELAKYYGRKKDNVRSLIFVAFTGEEEGGYGSSYFSGKLDPDKVVAMFNIEMIGTSSKWGENAAYITGFNRSSLGAILQRNLEGTGFRFHPDPYPGQHLFYRSDNATLARLGVPAHTISTSKMDNEPNYHKVSDEVSTLDLDNMTRIIRSIALSAKSIVGGKDTPTRVNLKKMQ